MKFGYIIKFHRIPWNHYNQLRSSMNSRDFKSSMEFGYITKFHGISWNSMESPYLVDKFHGIPWNYGSSMEREVTPNSMELQCRQMDYHQVPTNSMEFHGTLVPPNEISLSSMEFHFKWAPFQKGALSNDTSVPWNSMEYSMEFHGTSVRPNEISLISMEFHGTLRLSFYSIPCYPGLPWDIPWNSMELWSRQIRKSPSSKWFHGIR